MLKLEAMDPSVDFFGQFKDASETSVVLINIFHVPLEIVDAFIEAWADDARFFKTQPGFISTQIHRGLGNSGVFVNYAVWENAVKYGAAVQSQEAQRLFDAYPTGTVSSPFLHRKLAVDNVCVV